ncbi:segregation/condensation protein A [Patescibacteria group bacterium]|nr:segregation/condensation protein A [Patescibacteria group bacterium]
MPINVKTDVFEGPLDLLLELIEKRKLLINDVSLASVTDEYIARISGNELPVGETAEFVALAATLLLIKSRSLLPTLELSPDESKDIKELEYRLAVYQLIKEAARGVSSSLENAPLYEGNPPAVEPMFLFDTSATLESLRASIQKVIEEFPVQISLPKVAVKKIVSIEEMIQKMAGRVSSAFSVSFKEFSGLNNPPAGGRGEHIKHEIIVSFLALLELVKQGIIKAHQGDHFSDITLESDAVSTPTYE